MFNLFKKQKVLTAEEQKTANEMVEHFRATTLKNNTDALIKGIGGVLTEFARTINDNTNIQTTSLSRDLKRFVSNGEYKTVYALYFMKKDAKMKIMMTAMDYPVLVQVIAKNDYDAIDQAKKALTKMNYKPDEWDAIVTNKIDLSVEIPKEIAIEKKELTLPVETYITNLMYARDNFVDEQWEKDALTKAINNIKKKYANKS
jgi:hypothetical protein